MSATKICETHTHRCVGMPAQTCAYNIYTILRWGHRLIHSTWRNEWKWSTERDSIISLWWCGSPQRAWNESTALCPQHQTARSAMYQEKPIRYTKPSEGQPHSKLEWLYNHNMCLCLLSASKNDLPVSACRAHLKFKCENRILSALFEVKLLSVRSQWVRIDVVTVLCYSKWQAGWGLFLLLTPHILLSLVSLQFKIKYH